MVDCSNDSFAAWQQCLRNYVIQKYFHSYEIAIFTTAYIVLAVLGSLGNGLVIYVVIAKKEMRTTRNTFLVNLALSNFMLGLIWVPFLWVPTYENEFTYNAYFCKLANSFPGINIYCSTLTICAIAIDRYFAVSKIRNGSPNVQGLKVS